MLIGSYAHAIRYNILPHFRRFAYADDDDDDDAARLRARSPVYKARVCSGGSDGNRRLADAGHDSHSPFQ